MFKVKKSGFFLLGRQAVKVLLRHIEGESKPVQLQADLVPGASTGRGERQ